VTLSQQLSPRRGNCDGARVTMPEARNQEVLQKGSCAQATRVNLVERAISIVALADLAFFPGCVFASPIRSRN